MSSPTPRERLLDVLATVEGLGTHEAEALVEALAPAPAAEARGDDVANARSAVWAAMEAVFHEGSPVSVDEGEKALDAYVAAILARTNGGREGDDTGWDQHAADTSMLVADLRKKIAYYDHLAVQDGVCSHNMADTLVELFERCERAILACYNGGREGVCPACYGKGGHGIPAFDQNGEWQCDKCDECGGTGKRTPSPAPQGGEAGGATGNDSDSNRLLPSDATVDPRDWLLSILRRANMGGNEAARERIADRFLGSVSPARDGGAPRSYRIAGEPVTDAVGEEFGRLIAERDNLRQQVSAVNLLAEQTEVPAPFDQACREILATSRRMDYQAEPSGGTADDGGRDAISRQAVLDVVERLLGNAQLDEPTLERMKLEVRVLAARPAAAGGEDGEWFAVYHKGIPFCAYPRRLQAEVYAGGFSSDTEIRPLSSLSGDARRELEAWRMLARGEIPERMTAEQYAFSQEAPAGRDWGEKLAAWNDRMKAGDYPGGIGELVDIAKEAWEAIRFPTPAAR